MMFPRGTGPLVSVLLPTRGRPKWLCAAIDSVYSLAYDKAGLEFILKVDDDDTETITAASHLASMLPLRVIVSPRGNGFHDMHHWVNDMSKLASGDWLFLFNDDARMMTENWDVIIDQVRLDSLAIQTTEICILCANTIQRHAAQEFVFLRRKVFEVLGHFSMSPHNDNWIMSVMTVLRSAMLVSIDINHMSDDADDEVRQASLAAYKTTSPVLMTSASIRGVIADALKLQDYIDSIKEKK